MQVVLTQIAPAGAPSILGRLAERGIEAEVVDRPSTLALLFAFGTYRVRIAVEEADEARAREVLSSWSVEARPRVEDLARVVVRDCLLALLPALALGVALFLAGPGGRKASGLALLATWFVGALLLAWRRRRNAAEVSAPGPERPGPPERADS